MPLAATDAEIVEIIRAGLRPGRTKLLIVDQITSPTARLFPVAAIVAVARELGVPVLVDAAHAPGMLPVAVDQIGADFWVGNLHKWAYAPRGTAALVVAPRWRARIEPLVVSWEQQTGFPLSVEYQATLDYIRLAGRSGGTVHPAQPRGRSGPGAQRRAGRVRAAGGGCGARPGRRPTCPTPADRRSPCGSSRCRTAWRSTLPDAIALRQQVADKLGADVFLAPWNGRGWLRLSAQVYNRAEEYDRLAQHLPALLRQPALIAVGATPGRRPGG